MVLVGIRIAGKGGMGLGLRAPRMDRILPEPGKLVDWLGGEAAVCEPDKEDRREEEGAEGVGGGISVSPEGARTECDADVAESGTSIVCRDVDGVMEVSLLSLARDMVDMLRFGAGGRNSGSCFDVLFDVLALSRSVLELVRRCCTTSILLFFPSRLMATSDFPDACWRISIP